MSPSLELQTAIVSDLKSHAPLVAIVGNRVFDDRRKEVVFPFVSWGPEFSNDGSASCIYMDEMFLQIDVWSRQPSRKECKQIVDVIKRRLRAANYTINENALCLFELDGDRIINDPDGQTHHGIITIRATVEQR